MKNIINGILLFSSLAVFGQGFNKLSHVSGTQLIDGVNVKVTIAGKFFTDNSWCSEVGPYIPGYGFTASPSWGTVTFSFSPAVGTVSLNFSAVTDSAGAKEEVRLYKNGIHYAIPSPGYSNICAKKALLTSAGNIVGCAGCSLSGWNGTVIQGPITLLTIEDTISAGLPDGAYFSAFFNKIDVTGLSKQAAYEMNMQSVFPNPIQDKATIRFSEFIQNGAFLLYNGSGQLIKKMSDINSNELLLERGDLPAGIYFFILNGDNEIHARAKLVLE